MVFAIENLLTVDDYLRSRAANNGDKPMLSYAIEGGNGWTEYSYSEMHKLVDIYATAYNQQLPQRSTSDDPRITIALLGPTNLEYILSFLALQRLGLTCLFLSTRLGDPAYAHLFSKCECSHVIVAPSFQATIDRVAALRPGLQSVPLKGIDSVDLHAAHTELELRLDPEKENRSAGWIIHSSGSTGLPKPVGQVQAGSLMGCRQIPIYSNGYTTLPLFHTFGLVNLLQSLTQCVKVSFHPATLPQTAANILAGVEATGSRILYCVPYTMKLLSEAPSGIERLRAATDSIVFGGSSAPDDLGTRLVNAGLHLRNFYGSTECGVLMSEASRKLWNYLRVVPAAVPFVQWEQQPGSDDLFELVVRSGWPPKVYSNRPDGSYATRDLFQRHADVDNAECYKYVGRLDDTIVLSNGEKANPIPLEICARTNALVAECMAFGAERPSLGLIVIAAPAAAEISRDELVDAIWPDIEAGNGKLPNYAKITKESVLVMPVGTEYPRTDKGTAIRVAFVKQFAAEINAYYDHAAEVEAAGGRHMTEDEIRTLVHTTVVKALGEEVSDDEDFFTLGLDSLMAITIRSKIAREINTGGVVLGSNVIFEHPSVSALTSYLASLTGGAAVAEKSAEDVMRSLIEEYSHFTAHVPGDVVVQGEHVLLTGATGSLGSHILSQLLPLPTVSSVTCLVRANSPSAAHSRILAALAKARLPTPTEEQLQKLTCYPSDTSLPTLGLPTDALEKLRRETTNIIHCAWSVNFNLSAASFAPQLAGSHHLMSLALSSPQQKPARFSFISSVSTAMATPASALVDGKVPEILPELGSAMPMGYAHSKLATEHICAAFPGDARVLRVGQIVGDTKNGVWNATEAWPLTIRSADTLGVLPRPTQEELVSWLPVDVTAAAVVDIALAPEVDGRTFNIVHPRMVGWNETVIPALRDAGLKFQEVKPAEWLKVLAAHAEEGEKHPTVKLLEFFGGKYAEGQEGEAVFDTTRSCGVSKALREARPVDAALVGRFVESWRAGEWKQ
ncbi:hypothetical protein EDC01DRAFT_700856 [Geopyxis carbonaria]|nr:hypothetical protein EDC01DRAFT_700856 [Geopyxis carbonaria]